MKRALLGVALLVVAAACVSEAQTQTRPWLGSKQNIEASAFCKKYKCRKMPPENGLGYVLELPGDRPWENIVSDPDDKKLTVTHLWSLYRTVMHVELDEQTNQVRYVEFGLRQNFRANNGTYRPETVMLTDAVYHAMGKRLTLEKSQGELYSYDISDCFLASRAVPKENIGPATRVMMTVQVMLETQKRKVQARAVCSSRSNGSTPDRYLPVFWLELTPERG
jgi:hypothetical protein